MDLDRRVNCCTCRCFPARDVALYGNGDLAALVRGGAVHLLDHDVSEHLWLELAGRSDEMERGAEWGAGGV